MHRLEQLEGRTLFASYAAANVTELIAAMNAANASAGADTISLAPRATFSLTAPHNSSNGGNGLPRVTDGGLTIVGGAATVARSTATGTLPFRLFEVAPGASLTLRNLTVQGGLASSPDGLAPSQGGAIYNAGTLALDGVTVQNNVARGAPGYPWWYALPGADAQGGGVFSSGALTVTKSTFLNNQVVGGRGLDAFVRYPGAQPGSGGTIVAPSAGGNGYGGGVYVAAGTASLSASTFTANTAAGGDGGNGFYADDAGLGGNGFGGGLFAAGRSVELRTITATRNLARGGLGGVNGLTGSRAASGLATGGGIYVLDGTRASFDDYTVSHVTQNTASTSSPNIAGSYRRLR